MIFLKVGDLTTATSNVLWSQRSEVLIKRCVAFVKSKCVEGVNFSDSCYEAELSSWSESSQMWLNKININYHERSRIWEARPPSLHSLRLQLDNSSTEWRESVTKHSKMTQECHVPLQILMWKDVQPFHGLNQSCDPLIQRRNHCWYALGGAAVGEDQITDACAEECPVFIQHIWPLDQFRIFFFFFLSGFKLISWRWCLQTRVLFIICHLLMIYNCTTALNIYLPYYLSEQVFLGITFGMHHYFSVTLLAFFHKKA